MDSCIETSLNSLELGKIIRKWVMNIIVSLLFLLCFGYPLYYLIASDNKTIWDYLGIAACGIIVLLMLSLVINLIFNPKSLLKDLQYRLKISTKLIVDKKLVFCDNDNSSYTYRICFEKNDYLSSYELVNETVFDQINEGDIVYLECSKYGNWVLRIECNSVDLYNKSYGG